MALFRSPLVKEAVLWHKSSKTLFTADSGFSVSAAGLSFPYVQLTAIHTRMFFPLSYGHFTAIHTRECAFFQFCFIGYHVRVRACRSRTSTRPQR